MIVVANTVIPAKAGIQNPYKGWIPAFAGMTGEGYIPAPACAGVKLCAGMTEKKHCGNSFVIPAKDCHLFK
jgi:hypothetical protein